MADDDEIIEAELVPYEEEGSLSEDLQGVLNKHSAENQSNTPDYILAHFVTGVLDSYNEAVRQRDNWYDINPQPGKAFESLSGQKAVPLHNSGFNIAEAARDTWDDE